MSVELLATLISAFTLLLGFLGVIGWLATRVDRQLDALGNRLDARIDGVESSLGARIDKLDARMDKLETRVDEVYREVVEVKIAVARIEGPPRHLVLSR